MLNLLIAFIQLDFKLKNAIDSADDLQNRYMRLGIFFKGTYNILISRAFDFRVNKLVYLVLILLVDVGVFLLGLLH